MSAGGTGLSVSACAVSCAAKDRCDRKYVGVLLCPNENERSRVLCTDTGVRERGLPVDAARRAKGGDCAAEFKAPLNRSGADAKSRDI